MVRTQVSTVTAPGETENVVPRCFSARLRRVERRSQRGECDFDAMKSWRGAAFPRGLIAEVEVDARGEAETVLNVFGAVREARVDQIRFDDSEIKAVIDVQIDAAARLEIE